VASAAGSPPELHQDDQRAFHLVLAIRIGIKGSGPPQQRDIAAIFAIPRMNS